MQVVDDIGDDVRSAQINLIALEDGFADTALDMSSQTQEWKDALLRADRPELYMHHRDAFRVAARKVSDDLNRIERQMQTMGLATNNVVSYRDQHIQLISDYEAALALIDSRQPMSFRVADDSVRGKDRQLRDDLRAELERAETDVTTHLNDSTGMSVTRFWLIGLLVIFLPLVALWGFLQSARTQRLIAREDARERAIYHSIGDAIMVIDSDGCVDTLNPVAQKLTGWSQEDAIGRPISEVFKLYDIANNTRCESPAEVALRDKVLIPMSNGMVLRRRDGSESAVEDSAAPIIDENGTMIGVVMVFHDVSRRYALMAELRRERTFFQQTFEQAAVGIAHVSPQGRWLRVNQRLCDIVGYSEAELLGLSFQDITDPRDLSDDNEQVERMLNGEISQYSMEKRYIRKDASICWINLTVSLSRAENGTPDYFISVVEDIQARKMAEQSAESAYLQYQALFEQLPEGVLLFNHEMQVVSFNPIALQMLGYKSVELLRLHVWDIDATDDQQLVLQRAERLRATGADVFESRYRMSDGRLLDVRVSVRLALLPDGVEIFQCLFSDISNQKEAERQIEHLAYHDPLTGLPNRRLLSDRLNQAISGAMRRDAQVALLFLDLDHFKDVNDTMGHLFGDALLVNIAHRLQECIRNEDTLARVGGDEFVIVLNDVIHAADIAGVAEKIISHVGLPIQVGEESLHTNVSIGISLYPQDGRDTDTLLKYADAALYLSKQQGRMTYRFYTEELHAKAAERVQIERSLHKALARNEFELYYQPKVNLADQSIIGCEALIRWNRPGAGLTFPGQFIHVAEQSYLINQIGDWVIRTACRQASLWEQKGYKLRVAFNVSARQFMRPQELLNSLREAILESGVDPALLEMEMTESLLIDQQDMSNVLHEIRAMGVHLALDDFGTGYSSLSYLRRFPISTLKIDRSFISDADGNADDAEMVKTIIDMAHNLRMNLVAEGIETDHQSNLLCVYGCESGQGYYFGKPLPLTEFEALIEK